MKTSRFFGSTSREVMRQVRQVLGPDALIVSNRTVEGGVEVLACLGADLPVVDVTTAIAEAVIEAPTQPLEPIPAPVDPTVSVQPALSSSVQPPSSGQQRSTEIDLHSEATANLQDAIAALRGSLEARMDGLMWGGRQGPGKEPVNATLFRTLLEAGFSTALVRTLMERQPSDMTAEAALNWARNELVTSLPVLQHEEEFLGEGGVYALVGPTGVGKTTTLAKLAARCVAREGRDQVVMLTTDNFRIGAYEQLQIYGRLMGVPTHCVRDGDELQQILARYAARKIVLIDTTGISQRDRHVAEQAAMLYNAGRPVRRLLVLNAASQGDTLDEVAHAYRNGVGEDVAGCIITKLDEASHVGSALDTAIRHRLPIHYISRGQKVPEHLEVARANELVDQALASLTRTKALFAPSEADLAALWAAANRDGKGPLVDSAARRQLLASAIFHSQPGTLSSAKRQELDTAIAWLSADPACVQARQLWQSYMSDLAGRSDDLLSDAPLAMVRRDFAGACSRHLLAVHGQVTMKGARMPGGVLACALLMSDRGAALAAPMPQQAPGILSSFGGSTTPPTHANDALVARANWLSTQLATLPLVHVLEAGTAALLRCLSNAGLAWLSRCPSALRVLHDDRPTTLLAVSKTLGYLPVGPLVDFAEPAAGQVAPVLWVSGTEVALLAARRTAATPLRLVCARLINPNSGDIVRQLYGLTNVSAAQAEAAIVARWLVYQNAGLTAFRHIVHAWEAVPAVEGSQALARQALMAGQLGSACWQLAHAPSAAAMRALLGALMGYEPKLPTRLLPAALVKLFAMLEMAG